MSSNKKVQNHPILGFPVMNITVLYGLISNYEGKCTIIYFSSNIVISMYYFLYSILSVTVWKYVLHVWLWIYYDAYELAFENYQVIITIDWKAWSEFDHKLCENVHKEPIHAFPKCDRERLLWWRRINNLCSAEQQPSFRQVCVLNQSNRKVLISFNNDDVINPTIDLPTYMIVSVYRIAM